MAGLSTLAAVAVALAAGALVGRRRPAQFRGPIESLIVLPWAIQRVAEYADGRKEAVGLTDAIRFEILDRDTLDEALVLGDEVLIGQTILEKTDLLVDCSRNRVIPNPAHPDQPVSKVKSCRSRP